MYPVEAIPDTAGLFARIHVKNGIDANGIPKPNAFRQIGKGVSRGLSCDWGKYSTPEETLARGKQGPEQYCVVKFVAGPLRVKGLEVSHQPMDDNRGHSNIRWDDKDNTKYRAVLFGLHSIVIPCRDAVGEQSLSD